MGRMTIYRPAGHTVDRTKQPFQRAYYAASHNEDFDSDDAFELQKYIASQLGKKSQMIGADPELKADEGAPTDSLLIRYTDNGGQEYCIEFCDGALVMPIYFRKADATDTGASGSVDGSTGTGPGTGGSVTEDAEDPIEFQRLDVPTRSPICQAALLVDAMQGPGATTEWTTPTATAGCTTKVVAVVAGLLIGVPASAKAFVGAARFTELFAQWASNTKDTFSTTSNVMGLLASVPSMFFYYDSISRVSTSFQLWVQESLKAGATPHQLRFALAAYCQSQLPKTDHDSGKTQKLIDIILGVGYGGANFGMVDQSIAHVIASFPGPLNSNTFQIILLASTFLNNLFVGIDKAAGFTDDVAKWSDNHSFATERQAQLLSALDSFEAMLEKAYPTDADGTNLERHEAERRKLQAEINDYRMTHHRSATSTDVLALIEGRLLAFQAQINERTKPKAPTTRDTAEGEYVAVDMMAPPPSAYDNPVNASVVLHGENPVWESVTGGLAVVTTALTVSSNVGGIAAVLTPYIGGALAYAAGVVGSASAYGTNVPEINSWRDELLLACTNTKIDVKLNQKLKECDIYTFIGYIWAALAATNGFYYTRKAFEAIPVLEHLTGKSKLIADGFAWYASIATTATMTTTKGKPTGKLLKKLLQQGPFKKAPKTDMDIVAHLDKQIQMTLNSIDVLRARLETLIHEYKRGIAPKTTTDYIADGIVAMVSYLPCCGAPEENHEEEALLRQILSFDGARLKKQITTVTTAADNMSPNKKRTALLAGLRDIQDKLGSDIQFFEQYLIAPIGTDADAATQKVEGAGHGMQPSLIPIDFNAPAGFEAGAASAGTGMGSAIADPATFG